MRDTLILLMFFALAGCIDKAKTVKMTYPSRVSFSDSTCYNMTCQAIDDFNAGKYKIFEYNIVPTNDTNVIILKKMNIELIYGGCNVEEGIDCYRAIMDSVIKSKYPDSIINNPLNMFDRLRFKNEFFDLLDSANYKKNTYKVSQILNGLTGLSQGRACIQILIDKFGKPVQFKWLRGLDKNNDSIVISKLAIDRFEPMIIGKDSVNSILTVPIKIR